MSSASTFSLIFGPDHFLDASLWRSFSGFKRRTKQYLTRLYFPDEASNPEDPILQLVEAERRSTLIARNVPGRQGELEWDIVCATENETVFFDY